MNMLSSRKIVLALVAAWCCAVLPRAEAKPTLKSICRLKGQEENTLQGLGLVVGLHVSDCGSQMAVFELLPSAGSTYDATMAAAVSAVKDSAEGTPFAVAG